MRFIDGFGLLDLDGGSRVVSIIVEKSSTSEVFLFIIRPIFNSEEGQHKA